MVRECRPPAREPTRSGLVRRSTMATSTPANASSPANISPVGPPPATTTACSAILLNLRTRLRRQRRTERGACGKPRGALYIEGGKEWVLSFPLIIPCGRSSPLRSGRAARTAARSVLIPTGRDVIPRWPFYASVAVLGCECIACFFAGSIEWAERGVMVGIDSAEAAEQARFAIELGAIGATFSRPSRSFAAERAVRFPARAPTCSVTESQRDSMRCLESHVVDVSRSAIGG